LPDLNVLFNPTVITSHPEVLYNSGLCYAYYELTLEEQELICGMYYVDMGKLDFSSLYSITNDWPGKTKVRQDAHLLWWPKPGAWRASGKNLGFWTLDCEQWFKDLDSKYSANPITQQPQTAVCWRNAVNLFRPEKKIVEKH
jgi:hypothetical protein